MNENPRQPNAESIVATVVFADLVGFDHLTAASGSEAAYLAVTELLGQLDAIARQHGGSVDKYLGDKLMALFGHPVPLTHPSRAAALAALEMRRRVDEYNREADLKSPLRLRVGIDAGEVVSGEIRGPVVREFHVLGDVVNTAARINARAPIGEIWIGESVHDAIRESLSARALEPLRLKGKSHPVAVFALEAPRRSGIRQGLGLDERPATALIGRAAELAVLETHLERLAAGDGGCLHLAGAAGAGKTRLLAALAESPHMARVQALRVDAGGHDVAEPLAGFAELSSFARSAAGGDAEGDAARATPARRGADDPEAALARLKAGLMRLARSKPLLIVVEDLHRIDAETARVLDRLRAWTAEAPLSIVTTGHTRAASGPTQTAAQAVTHAAPAPVETLWLAPLAASDRRALVLAVPGIDGDDHTVELVMKRGGALPGDLLRTAFLAPVLRSEHEQAADRDDRSSDAERRRAVVVFADLTGFTAMTERLGAERTYPVVAKCLEILDEVTRKHGGTIDHYLGDCVMALFGVPRALEDAPRAALNAAIEMRARIQAFSASEDLGVPVDVHTGVATGLGIAGDISGPMIREFAVMGDHVDRADALTHLAEGGQIFVDAATHRATRDVFDFEASAPRLLPGADAPQPVYDLRSDAVRVHRSDIGSGRQVFSELVGRDEQLAVMASAVESLATGRGGIISLSAEAGIGKSRLLAEMSRSPQVEAITWVIGRAVSNGRNLGYHPVVDLLRSWTRIDDDDDDASARRRLDEAVAVVLPDDTADTAPLLVKLMGLELSPEERERIDSIQGDAAEKIVRAAFVRLLRAGSALRPVAFVMEDLHWADLSSVELVESVLGLAALHPILFINAFRPGFPDTSGRVLEACRSEHAALHTELSLVPLDASAARAMVKNLFRGGDIPQRTRSAIEERAQGNPFYIEEVVRTLVDLGAVRMQDGVFRATEKLASVQIPHTVQDAVMARVDRLDLARRSVLQAASVIGGSFHLDVLMEVVDATDLEGLLEDLQRQEFITHSDRSAGVEYAFKHPLIPEIIYESLLVTRREELHLAVADATERQLNEGIPGYSAMLAFHFSRGRELSRAEEYLFRAGDEASRSAASNEALHFFQEASALYDQLHAGGGDPAKRARLEKSLAVALMNRGRLIEAADHFDHAAGLLGHVSPRSPVRMGLQFVRNLALVLARLYARRLYGANPASEREKELLDIMFRRAMAQSTTNPIRFFVDSTEALRNLSRVDPLSVPESAALYSGVIAIFAFGGLSFGISRRFLAVADDLAASGAVGERYLYYRTLGFLHHLLAGEWSDEITIEPALVEEGIREGRFWEASTCLDLDCYRQIYRGNFEHAQARIDRLAEMADLYENELASSAMLGHKAFLHVERRELEAALDTINLYYDEHSEILFNIIALGTRGRVNALRGRLDEAEAEIHRAEGLMREAGRVPPFHASNVHSARHLLDLLRAEALVSPGRSALRRLGRSRRRNLTTSLKVPWRRTEALRMAGREAWLRGDWAAAIGWWSKAIDFAEHLGARPELARTLADAGAASARSGVDLDLAGRDAAACLRDADDLFAQLGLSPEREALLRVA